MTSTTHPIRFDSWCRWLFRVLGTGPRSSRVTVDEHTDGPVVSVAMGWAFRAEFPASSIRRSRHDDDRVLGWGVHGWRGTWLVNGSSDGIVAIDLEPAARAHVVGVPIQLRTLRVGLEEPEALLQRLDEVGVVES